MDWNQHIGSEQGFGGLWERLGSMDAFAATWDAAYGLGRTGDYPVALFVRVVTADRDDPSITYEQRHGPVAVLQILPDGQGVVRLDR